MLVIPAIDLKDGRCVRLRQGDLREETVYSDDPPAMARHWEAQGARLLHLVDLNGAVEGGPRNLAQIEAILRAVSIPVQVGGGIRSLDTVRDYLSRGVARVVLGTAVLQYPALIGEACAEFPAKVLVGIDARDGRVALRGWTALSDTTATDLVRSLSAYPLAGVIYTDIARDGMMEGPNLTALRAMSECSPVPVIASGGITRVADLVAIKALGPRMEGAIVGKALYEGKLDLQEALNAASDQGSRAC
jgi:phosphoribosylformimino-5-aminoimidazole carboxamide ribotide isomerase